MGKFVSAMSTHQPDALRFILTSLSGARFLWQANFYDLVPRRTLRDQHCCLAHDPALKPLKVGARVGTQLILGELRYPRVSNF